MSTQSQSQAEQGKDARAASPDDTKALIGLLENLVPLLLHFRSQTPHANGAIAFAGPQGAELEQQAAVTFTEDIILDTLRNLSSYLERNGNRYPGLDTYRSVVERAQQALNERNYQAALALILDTYRAVTVVRAIRPELPPIRERGNGEPEAAQRSVH